MAVISEKDLVEDQAICTYEAVKYITNEPLIDMLQDSISSNTIMQTIFIWLAVVWGVVGLVLLYKSLPNKTKKASMFKINIIGSSVAAIIALAYGSSILGDLIHDQNKLLASTKADQRNLGEPSAAIRAACDKNITQKIPR